MNNLSTTDRPNSKAERHPLQRSSHFVPGLRSVPWWNTDDFPTLVLLAKEFEAIRDEFINILCCGQLRLHPRSSGGPRRQLTDGDWNIFELCSHGHINTSNAILAPRTVQVLQGIPDATSHRNGLVYFSVLHPHVHVSAHCGPTNSRIRVHLGLRVPDGAAMRVGNETRQWREGECLVFDDSWEHEVFNQGDFLRAVLLMDVWHPDLTPQQKAALLFSDYDDPKHLDERKGWIRELDPEASYSTGPSFCSQTGFEHIADILGSLQRGQALLGSVFSSLQTYAFQSEDMIRPGVIRRSSISNPDCCELLWEWLASLNDRHSEKFFAQDAINLLHLGSGYWLSMSGNERMLRSFMQSDTPQSLTSLIDHLRAASGISELLRFAASKQRHVPFSLLACLSVIVIREISDRKAGTAG
jgi:aspartyl/asparaginyl beta-hydroxylase (cupin superfamily)